MMNKLVLFSFGCLLMSNFALAQGNSALQNESKNQDVKKVHTIDTQYRDKISKLLNSKIYRDPYIMSHVINSIANQNAQKKDFSNVNLETIFTTKDSQNIIENAKKIDVNTPVSEEENKKIWLDPQGAYLDMVMKQEIPAIKTEEVRELSGVDKKAVSNFMMMMTDAGPELGNQQVSIQIHGFE